LSFCSVAVASGAGFLVRKAGTGIRLSFSGTRYATQWHRFGTDVPLLSASLTHKLRAAALKNQLLYSTDILACDIPSAILAAKAGWQFG
jgi:hypothetical protein